MTTLPLGKAARAMRAVSEGISPIGFGWRHMDQSFLLEHGSGIRRQYHHLVGVPAPANLTTPPFAESFGQQGSQLGLPIPDRLMSEDHAPDQKHFGKVAQAQLVAQPPEDHEKRDRYNLDNFRLWDAQTL